MLGSFTRYGRQTSRLHTSGMLNKGFSTKGDSNETPTPAGKVNSKNARKADGSQGQKESSTPKSNMDKFLFNKDPSKAAHKEPESYKKVFDSPKRGLFNFEKDERAAVLKQTIKSPEVKNIDVSNSEAMRKQNSKSFDFSFSIKE